MTRSMFAVPLLMALAWPRPAAGFTFTFRSGAHSRPVMALPRNRIGWNMQSDPSDPFPESDGGNEESSSGPEESSQQGEDSGAPMNQTPPADGSSGPGNPFAGLRRPSFPKGSPNRGESKLSGPNVMDIFSFSKRTPPERPTQSGPRSSSNIGNLSLGNSGKWSPENPQGGEAKPKTNQPSDQQSSQLGSRPPPSNRGWPAGGGANTSKTSSEIYTQARPPPRGGPPQGGQPPSSGLNGSGRPKQGPKLYNFEDRAPPPKGSGPPSQGGPSMGISTRGWTQSGGKETDTNRVNPDLYTSYGKSKMPPKGSAPSVPPARPTPSSGVNGSGDASQQGPRRGSFGDSKAPPKGSAPSAPQPGSTPSSGVNGSARTSPQYPPKGSAPPAGSMSSSGVNGSGYRPAKGPSSESFSPRQTRPSPQGGPPPQDGSKSGMKSPPGAGGFAPGMGPSPYMFKSGKEKPQRDSGMPSYGMNGDASSYGMNGDTASYGMNGDTSYGMNGDTSSYGMNGDTSYGMNGDGGPNGMNGDQSSYGMNGDRSSNGMNGDVSSYGMNGDRSSYGNRPDEGPRMRPPPGGGGPSAPQGGSGMGASPYGMNGDRPPPNQSNMGMSGASKTGPGPGMGPSPYMFKSGQEEDGDPYGGDMSPYGNYGEMPPPYGMDGEMPPYGMNGGMPPYGMNGGGPRPGGGPGVQPFDFKDSGSLMGEESISSASPGASKGSFGPGMGPSPYNFKSGQGKPERDSGMSSSYGTNGDASSYGMNGDTSSYGMNGDTSSYGMNGDTSSYGLNGDTASYGMNGDTASYGMNGDTASYGMNGDVSSYDAAPDGGPRMEQPPGGSAISPPQGGSDTGPSLSPPEMYGQGLDGGGGDISAFGVGNEPPQNPLEGETLPEDLDFKGEWAPPESGKDGEGPKLVPYDFGPKDEDEPSAPRPGSTMGSSLSGKLPPSVSHKPVKVHRQHPAANRKPKVNPNFEGQSYLGSISSPPGGTTVNGGRDAQPPRGDTYNSRPPPKGGAPPINQPGSTMGSSLSGKLPPGVSNDQVRVNRQNPSGGDRPRPSPGFEGQSSYLGSMPSSPGPVPGNIPPPTDGTRGASFGSKLPPGASFDPADRAPRNPPGAGPIDQGATPTSSRGMSGRRRGSTERPRTGPDGSAASTRPTGASEEAPRNPFDGENPAFEVTNGPPKGSAPSSPQAGTNIGSSAGSQQRPGVLRESVSNVDGQSTLGARPLWADDFGASQGASAEKGGNAEGPSSEEAEALRFKGSDDPYIQSFKDRLFSPGDSATPQVADIPDAPSIDAFRGGETSTRGPMPASPEKLADSKGSGPSMRNEPAWSASKTGETLPPSSVTPMPPSFSVRKPDTVEGSKDDILYQEIIDAVIEEPSRRFKSKGTETTNERKSSATIKEAPDTFAKRSEEPTQPESARGNSATIGGKWVSMPPSSLTDSPTPTEDSMKQKSVSSEKVEDKQIPAPPLQGSTAAPRAKWVSMPISSLKDKSTPNEDQMRQKRRMSSDKFDDAVIEKPKGIQQKVSKPSFGETGADAAAPARGTPFLVDPPRKTKDGVALEPGTVARETPEDSLRKPVAGRKEPTTPQPPTSKATKSKRTTRNGTDAETDEPTKEEFKDNSSTGAVSKIGKATKVKSKDAASPTTNAKPKEIVASQKKEPEGAAAKKVISEPPAQEFKVSAESKEAQETLEKTSESPRPVVDEKDTSDLTTDEMISASVSSAKTVGSDKSTFVSVREGLRESKDRTKRRLMRSTYEKEKAAEKISKLKAKMEADAKAVEKALEGKLAETQTLIDEEVERISGLFQTEIALEEEREELVIGLIDSLQDSLEVVENEMKREARITKEMLTTRSKLKDGRITAQLDTLIAQKEQVAKVDQDIAKDLNEGLQELQSVLTDGRERRDQTERTMKKIGDKPEIRTDTPYEWSDIEELEVALERAADLAASAEKHIRVLSLKVDEALVRKNSILGEPIPPGLETVANKMNAAKEEAWNVWSASQLDEDRIDTFGELQDKEPADLVSSFAGSLGKSLRSASKFGMFGMKALLDSAASTDESGAVVKDTTNSTSALSKKEKKKKNDSILADPIVNATGSVMDAGSSFLSNMSKSGNTRKAGAALKETSEDLLSTFNAIAALTVKVADLGMKKVEDFDGDALEKDISSKREAINELLKKRNEVQVKTKPKDVAVDDDTQPKGNDIQGNAEETELPKGEESSNAENLAEDLEQPETKRRNARDKSREAQDEDEQDFSQ